jgi:hypothetical protein
VLPIAPTPLTSHLDPASSDLRGLQIAVLTIEPNTLLVGRQFSSEIRSQNDLHVKTLRIKDDVVAFDLTTPILHQKIALCISRVELGLVAQCGVTSDNCDDSSDHCGAASEEIDQHLDWTSTVLGKLPSLKAVHVNLDVEWLTHHVEDQWPHTSHHDSDALSNSLEGFINMTALQSLNVYKYLDANTSPLRKPWVTWKREHGFSLPSDVQTLAVVEPYRFTKPKSSEDGQEESQATPSESNEETGS